MYKTLNDFFKKFFSVRQIYQYGFNWSPMYRRSTGKLIVVSEDLHFVKIKIPLNYKNRNYVGSIFGGSMLSATDPIFMIQLMQILGDNFIVWDKATTIQYKRPATQMIFGEFVFTAEEIQDLKDKVAMQNEVDIIKNLQLVTSTNIVVADISKTIYVADKKFYKEKLRRRKYQTILPS